VGGLGCGDLGLVRAHVRDEDIARCVDVDIKCLMMTGIVGRATSNFSVRRLRPELLFLTVFFICEISRFLF
jgi:hypothetical protein